MKSSRCRLHWCSRLDGARLCLRVCTGVWGCVRVCNAITSDRKKLPPESMNRELKNVLNWPINNRSELLVAHFDARATLLDRWEEEQERGGEEARRRGGKEERRRGGGRGGGGGACPYRPVLPASLHRTHSVLVCSVASRSITSRLCRNRKSCSRDVLRCTPTPSRR